MNIFLIVFLTIISYAFSKNVLRGFIQIKDSLQMENQMVLANQIQLQNQIKTEKNVKLYVKWRTITSDQTIPLTPAMMEVNMNAITMYQWVGSSNQVGEEIWSKPIVTFKMLQSTLISDQNNYFMYYKDSTEVIIENNLKTALYLFQNNGYEKCRILVEEDVDTGVQTPYFFCIQYESGGDFNKDMKNLIGALDGNYVHALANADFVNIPLIRFTEDFRVWYKVGNAKEMTDGVITAQKNSFILRDRWATDKLAIKDGGAYKNIVNCDFNHPVNPNSIKKEAKKQCCFSYEIMEYTGQMLPKIYTICSTINDSIDKCQFQARQLIKELKFHCYLMMGDYVRLQTLINMREFNEIVKTAAPSMLIAMNSAAKNAQKPADFFAKGPMGSAAVKVGQKDMREIQAELLENSLSKLAEIDPQDDDEFKFPDSAIKITDAQKAIIESAVQQIATDLSNKAIYLKEPMPDDLFPIPKPMTVIDIRDAVCDAQVLMLNSLKEIANLQPELSPVAEQDFAVGLANVIAGAYHEYQADRNELATIETIKAASEIEGNDDNTRKEIAAKIGETVNDDAAIEFTATFIDNFQRDFQKEFLNNNCKAQNTPCPTNEQMDEMITFAQNKQKESKGESRFMQLKDDKQIKELIDGLKQKMAYYAKLSPEQLGDEMSGFMKDNTESYTNNVVAAAKAQGNAAIKNNADSAADESKEQINQEIAAAKVPVSKDLAESFSGMSDKLAAEAGKLMKVDPASPANAFDSIPKLPTHPQMEKLFGKKAEKEPSLADKLAKAAGVAAKGNSYLLDAQDMPVCKLDDKQLIKKNKDESYSYANTFTGDKITFKLAAGQFLDCSAYAADPISKIFHTNQVIEESISSATSEHLAQEIAERVDHHPNHVEGEKHLRQNSKTAHTIYNIVTDNMQNLKNKIDHSKDDAVANDLVQTDEGKQRFQVMQTPQQLKKKIENENSVKFKQVFDQIPVTENCKTPPCNTWDRAIGIHRHENGPREGDNLLVGIPTFTFERQKQPEKPDCGDDNDTSTQPQETQDSQQARFQTQNENLKEKVNYGANLLNFGRFRNTYGVQKGNDLVVVNRNNTNGDNCQPGQPCYQNMDPIKKPQNTYNESECKTTGKNCGVVEQKQDFGVAPNPENIGEGYNTTNVNNLNTINSHNTMNIIDDMQTNNFENNHHRSQIQNHYIFPEQEFSVFTGNKSKHGH